MRTTALAALVAPGALATVLAAVSPGLAQPPEPVVLCASPLRATPARTALPCGPRPTELPPLPGQDDGCDCPNLFPLLDAGLGQTMDGSLVTRPVAVVPAPVPRWKENALQRSRSPRSHFWVSGEPLVWWTRPGDAPVLLARADGSPLAGGEGGLHYGPTAGVRAAAGLTSPANSFGLEGSGFLLHQTIVRFPAASDPNGGPALLRPWRDAGGAPASLAAADPGRLAGSVSLSSGSMLWGADVQGVARLWSRPWLGLDLTGGFRYLDLNEDLTIAQRTGVLQDGAAAFQGEPLSAGASVAILDAWRTRNQFYGPQFGSQLEMRWRRLYTHLVGRAAVGVVHEVSDYRGETAVSGLSGTSPSAPGGLLGQPGPRVTQDEFAVVPEVNVNLGYQLSPGARLYAGWSFLYLSEAIRPGELALQAAGTARTPALTAPGPATGWTGSSPTGDYWTRGLNFGLALRY